MKEFDIENFPTSESAKTMLHAASEDFYEKSYVFKWILQVMGLEWDKAKVIIVDELKKQFFIETATWGLRYHEEKWGLPVMENLNYEERRRRLYERRDLNAPMIPYTMEQYVKKTTGGDICIVDCYDNAADTEYRPEHPNIFKVIVDANSIDDVREILYQINRIKQSHTMLDVIDLDTKSIEIVSSSVGISTTWCADVIRI